MKHTESEKAALHGPVVKADRAPSESLRRSSSSSSATSFAFQRIHTGNSTITLYTHTITHQTHYTGPTTFLTDLRRLYYSELGLICQGVVPRTRTGKKSFMITRLVALAALNNNSNVSSTPRELLELNTSRVHIHTLYQVYCSRSRPLLLWMWM